MGLSNSIFVMLLAKYYFGTECAMIMFDVTSRVTYKNASRWYREFVRICDQLPLVVVGNKVQQSYIFYSILNLCWADLKETAVKQDFSLAGYKCCVISAKENSQLNEPFLILLRQLLK